MASTTAFFKTHVLLCICFGLLACGGGSGTENIPPSSPTPPAPTPVPPAPTPEQMWDMQIDAARLLSQASFGATVTDIDAVVEMGPEAWIDRQFSLPITRQLTYFDDLLTQFEDDEEISRSHRIEAWWHASLYADDQLRQRTAFALSQLMVISERSNFFEDYRGIIAYYDLLAEHAFGNYRDLLEQVSLSPMMGMYLSMLGNEKADLTRNIRPDENYAREIMQLFSIGLIELNLDGTAKLGSNNQGIPTYDQSVIENYAKVFTGWHFAGTDENTWYQWWNNYETQAPMSPVEAFHDKSEKTLLSGIVAPANQSARADLEIALDSLFMHPNTAPFVSKHLITRLVSSNPSPAYVERVSKVFIDNGNGVRGDLKALIKAILLDEEARRGHISMPERFGKLREPILKATHLWRAFNVSAPENRILLGWPDYYFNQAPLAAPSVFNFYLPDYTTPGELSERTMVSPELQIITETYAVRQTNFLAYFGLWSYQGKPDGINDLNIAVDFSQEIEMIDDPDALIQRLNLLLMSGKMSDNYKAILKQGLEESEGVAARERVANLVFLVMSSPQYALQQ